MYDLFAHGHFLLAYSFYVASSHFSFLVILYPLLSSLVLFILLFLSPPLPHPFFFLFPPLSLNLMDTRIRSYLRTAQSKVQLLFVLQDCWLLLLKVSLQISDGKTGKNELMKWLKDHHISFFFLCEESELLPANIILISPLQTLRVLLPKKHRCAHIK